MIRWSPLIALLASSLVTTHAQEAAQGRAAQPAARAGRAAQPAQAQAQPANDPKKMKWLLEKWEGQSAKLDTLDVRIYRIDKDPKWQEELHFEGRAIFKSPNLAYLNFSKIKVAPDAKRNLARAIDPKTGKPFPPTRTETIICGQNEVWQYLFEGRKIYIFPLAKGERQRALDEGPLPFLFNMKAQEAERRYEMAFAGENQKYYAVKVYPKLQEDKESFKSALIYLDKTYLLPARIALISPDGRSVRDFTLSDIKANQPVAANIFKGGVPAKGGWVVERPAAVAPQQGNAAGRPAGAGGTPRR
jgi:TIGR03009 family protein